MSGAEGPAVAGRRAVVLGALALVAAASVGCGERPPAAAPGPALPPLALGRVDELLAVARLRWVVLARLRDVATTAFLIPAIGRVVPEANLDRFAAATGVDLRTAEEAAMAVYADDGGKDVTAFVVRRGGDATTIERLFLARLVGGERRAQDRPDVARLTGKFGTSSKTLAVLGRDVVVFQDGGSPARGPARVAELYAEGKLKRSPTLLAADPLRSLAARFGPAPVRAFALGPFEGELARGARGLLAGATAIGAAARPSARERVALSIAVAGDFTTSGAAASTELADAWDDLAKGSLGHMLGLDRPAEKPLATFGADAVAIALELDPNRLADGLARATGETLAQIFR